MDSGNVPADDSSCPVAFMAIPAVLAALIWLCALLGQLPQ
jgi:hypothetical protein